jgi:hypothetical protein
MGWEMSIQVLLKVRSSLLYWSHCTSSANSVADDHHRLIGWHL